MIWYSRLESSSTFELVAATHYSALFRFIESVATQDERRELPAAQ
jgi:hypothetical protein